MAGQSGVSTDFGDFRSFRQNQVVIAVKPPSPKNVMTGFASTPFAVWSARATTDVPTAATLMFTVGEARLRVQ
jgi:hypothetical protein